MDKNVLVFIFKLIKPFKIRILVITVCMIVVSFLSILYPMLQRILFDDGLVRGNINIVIQYTLLILGLYVVEQIIAFIQFTCYQIINKQISFKLMYEAVNHSIRLKMSYHKDNNFLKIIGNVQGDVTSISQIINTGLLQTALSFFKIIGGIIGLCLIDWRLTFCVLMIAPFEMMSKNRISSKKQKYLKKYMKVNENFSIWFGEIFKNIEVIKLWNLQDKRMKEFESLKKEMIVYEKKMEYSDNFANISSQTLGMIFTHGINLLGAIFIMQNQLTIGGLFAFISYSTYVLQPVSSLTNLLYMLNSSKPAFKRYMEYFDNDIECEEGIELKDESMEIEKIIFDNVVFAYENKKSILNSVNFSIKKGEKIGFIGLNGSGKTTIINLLLRFFEPTSGVIQLNGINIQNIALDEYRKIFCVMNQGSSLFDDTIRNNVNILENLSEDEIYYFLNLTTSTEFIKSLPKGIDSSVGFNGGKISGGEKQKVALARTLAKRGRILILDEATANFDLSAEMKFDQYIMQCNLYDIIIIISHREDILKRLDKIFYIDSGVICDFGSYNELIERNSGLFERLSQEEKKV